MRFTEGKRGKSNNARLLTKRFIAGFLTAVLAASSLVLTFPEKASAARRQTILSLATAKTVAICNSEKIEAIEMQIEAKQAARESAIRSLKEKERSMQTFRWSPLLNFKFPTTPNEAEAFEFSYKPTQLQYDIDTLKHKINDLKLQENEKVSGIYIDIITSTAEITFLNQRISNLEKTLLKNKARLALGLATEAQIKMQEKKLEGYKKSLSSEKTKLQRSKDKLGKEVGFTITEQYLFEDAFVTTNIDRQMVESLQKHAKETDQTVFEAKQAEELAKLELMTNYELMKQQYGGDINMISAYVQQALDGGSIDKRAFKKKYDEFLKKIDDPWVGKKRILFFKFPKEWWKGDTDGIRYVEDDPYVLYASALEYESALKEYNNACNELDSAIAEGYDNLMETRKAYITAKNDLETLKQQLIYDEALNALGQMSLEEYDTELGEYESARSALKDALSLYSKTLFEFDRTTCGAVSEYFIVESLTTQAGHAGLGTPPEGSGDAVEDALDAMQSIIKKGATYSIRSIVDSEEFMLYIDIPDDFEFNVTHFELWSDGRQIGERTPKNESIKHLTLTVTEVESVSIALYNNDEFIDKCAIDPTVSYGPLNITTGYEKIDPNAEKYVGSYTLEEDENTDMIKLRFTFDKEGVAKNYNTDQEVAFYNLSAQQNLYLFSNDLIKADNPFTYMSFIKNDVGKLTVRMFAEDGSYIGGASINSNDKKLYADEDITLADVQEALARQIVVEKKSEDLLAEKERLEDMLSAAESIDTGEAESPTVTHYKERLAEIEEELSDIANNVTAEEIAQSLKDNAAEIAKRISESESAAKLLGEDGGDELDAKDAAAAKSAILRAAAEDFVKESKLEALTKQINESILANEKEKARLIAEYNKETDEKKKEDLKKQIDNISAQIAADENKLKSLDLKNISASEDEILNAMDESSDDIYSKAADKLTDPMLYGSEIGQWAIAYLENEGLPTTKDNIRSVVKMADLIDDYEASMERMDVLLNGLEAAKAKSAKLRESNTVTDKALADQLDNIADSYRKEIAEMVSVIQKADPAKEVRVADLRKEKEEALGKIEGIDKQIEELPCTRFKEVSGYVAGIDAEISALQVQYNALSTALKTEKEKMQTEISRLDQDAEKITATRDECLKKYEQYKTEYEQFIKDNPKGSFTYKILHKAMERELESLKAEYTKAQEAYGLFYFEGTMSDGSISKGAEIAKLKADLDTYVTTVQAQLDDLNTQITDKQTTLGEMTEEWYDSQTTRAELRNKKTDLNKRITEIDNKIAEYY